MNTRRQLLIALGSIVGAPFTGLAQRQGRLWRIGVMATGKRLDESVFQMFWGRIPARLKELGHVESRDFTVEWRFAGGDYARLPGIASELVGLPVDLIVTDGTPGIRAAQGATKMIPIVFIGGADLVAGGFVKSLARPGGNTTGVSLLLSDTTGKQMELIQKLVPKLSRVAILTNPSNPAHASLLKSFQATAASLGLHLVHVEARTPKEIEEAFPRLAREEAGGLIWAVDTFLIQQRWQLAELSARHRIPCISGLRDYPEVGGLMGYGPNRVELFLRAADYVDKIMKGANPGELPVEQPSKLELLINRATAKSLGLTIPPELLLLADRVIE